MNYRATFHVLGLLLMLLAIALCIPAIFAVLDGDDTWKAFLTSAGITLAIGLVLFFGLKSSEVQLSHREGFGIVALTWVLFSIFGAIPYMLTEVTPSWIDAYFEAVSGFTTTGATVLSGLDFLPNSILFWRSFTQWMGGMGIIVLSIAILPFLGVGGMQLYFAETPGPSKDRLTPRIQDTAKLLWGVYFLFTAIQTVLLIFGGVEPFHALCHSMSTLSTGGFSTFDASVGAYDSVYVHWVFIFSMFLAGVSFSMHFQALRGRVTAPLKSDEFKVYASLMIFVTLTLTVVNWVQEQGDFIEQLTDSAFQAVSLGTGTGFATRDYELWPFFDQTMLLTIMLFGGCAGSTTGGIKIIRIVLIFKYSFNEIFRLLHPKAVKPIKLDKRPVPPEMVQTIMGLAALFFCVLVTSALTLAATGVDILTSVSATIACLANVGPGFGTVGPSETYAHLPDVAKMVLSACMVIGRLEFYTALILLFPSFWRK